MKSNLILLLILFNSIIYSQTYKIKNSDQTIEAKELSAFNTGTTVIILDENFSLPFKSPNWLYYHKKTKKLYRFENGLFVETDKTKWKNDIKVMTESQIDAEKSLLEAEKSLLEAEKTIKNLKTN